MPANSRNVPRRGNLEEGDEEIGLTVGPIRMEDGGEYRGRDFFYHTQSILMEEPYNDDRSTVVAPSSHGGQRVVY